MYNVRRPVGSVSVAVFVVLKRKRTHPLVALLRTLPFQCQLVVCRNSYRCALVFLFGLEPMGADVCVIVAIAWFQSKCAQAL